MHYHCEVILPPCKDYEKVVSDILDKYQEGRDDCFFDWYVFGGRFSGSKLIAKLDPEKIDKFYDLLEAENITVSSIRAGKEELMPSSQIEKVDAMFRDFFPESGFKQCIFFDHADAPATDVCTLSQTPDNLEASTVIIMHENSIKWMIKDRIWNGFNHQKSQWGGGVLEAVKIAKDYYIFKDKNIISDDWLVVTLDYHN